MLTQVDKILYCLFNCRSGIAVWGRKVSLISLRYLQVALNQPKSGSKKLYFGLQTKDAPAQRPGFLFWSNWANKCSHRGGKTKTAPCEARGRGVFRLIHPQKRITEGNPLKNREIPYMPDGKRFARGRGVNRRSSSMKRSLAVSARNLICREKSN